MFAQRTRDWIYLVYLAVHIPVTLVVDAQAIFFAKSISPDSLRAPFIFAARDDPLLQNATNPVFAWFQAFIILEVVFQLPTFFLGVRGLYRNSPSIYPLLALYGASCATTTYACLATVLYMPGISQAHLIKLLASYIPFLLIPLAMAIDFGMRLTRIARLEEIGKRKIA
ncbi:hypothetical protein JCM5353_000930 [Sporobolomyces roseus]